MARFLVPPLRRGWRRAQRSYGPVRAELSESLNANHGRMQITACRLEESDSGRKAVPIRSKSGLITQLAGADGYFIIDRDCEGLPADAVTDVYWT